MKIYELVNALDEKYQFNNQEEWDQCGVSNLLKIDTTKEINKVIVSLDITKELIQKAIKTKANVIITHHPIYVGEYEEQQNKEWIDNIVELLNNNQIIHIALHTCYDMHQSGTSYQIIRHLFNVELDKIYRLDNSNYCDYFELDKPITTLKLVKQLKKAKLLSNIRFLEKFKDNFIKNIGVVGGSGYSEINNILNSETKIDCLLTGDVKWHNFIDSSELNFPVIDIGHDAEWLGMYSIYLCLEKSYCHEFKLEFVKPIQLTSI